MMKFLLSLVVSSLLFVQPVASCAQFGGKAGMGGNAGTGGGPSSSGAVASYVQSCSSTGSTCAMSPTASDLLAGCAVWTGTAGNITMTDGTSGFTVLTRQTDGAGDYMQCYYLLSANSGTHTYAVTFPSGFSFPWMYTTEFSATSGTWHYDTQAGQGASSSASASSGIFTTHQASGEVILDSNNLSNTGASVSNPLIGSTTPTEFSFSPLYGQDYQYYLLNTSISSATATLTYTPATDWICIATTFAAY